MYSPCSGVMSSSKTTNESEHNLIRAAYYMCVFDLCGVGGHQ